MELHKVNVAMKFADMLFEICNNKLNDVEEIEWTEEWLPKESKLTHSSTKSLFEQTLNDRVRQSNMDIYNEIQKDLSYESKEKMVLIKND